MRTATLLFLAVSQMGLIFGGCAGGKMEEGHYLNLRNADMPMTGMGAGLATTGEEKRPDNSETRVVLAAEVADPAAVQRVIIYQAGLSMTVPDIAGAEREVQRVAGVSGGYLQELDGVTVTVRVPAGKFEEVLAAVEKLGEVTDRHVKANDVTEEMRDLGIRLANAEDVRKRLAELVEKSVKMEDTIALERELERVTETIELIKGKMQFLQSQVAMSTIRVMFNSPLPQKEAVMALPFAWVRDLGDGVVTGETEGAPDTSRLWKRNERFELPPGFVRYFERDHITEAMSGDEVVIKLQRQDNYDGGEVDFWEKLARKALVGNRGIALVLEKDKLLKDGTAARWMVGTKDLGDKKQGYAVGIAATKRYVYTFEAWGEKEKLEKALPALEGAFWSLDVKHW